MTTQLNPKWHFNRRRPCDRVRDSANEAFFTGEGLNDWSEALVREAIQNSLDAAQREDLRFRDVHIRIALHSKATPAAKEFLDKNFRPVAEHFSKGLNGKDTISLLENPSFIVIEDFGTRGLEGDINEYRDELSSGNAFFSFFRADGRSGKSGVSLGRWGIGKQVFPASSRLQTMFGLSIREDSPSRVLMGSAVLKNHSIGDKDYQPDAWFGCREDDKDEDIVNPVIDEAVISVFSEAFGLIRDKESGLSVVIPFSDDRVSPSDVVNGIIKSFFWPILQGELTVDIEFDGTSHRIDAENLSKFRRDLPANELAIIELANWAAFVKQNEYIELSSEKADKPQWKERVDVLLNQEKLEEIRHHLVRTQNVAIKIPLIVRSKNGGPSEMSYFKVYIQECRDAGGKTVFLRDGILIAGIRSQVISSTRSMVVVDDAPLATLLGDSEGVNHTEWQRTSQKFREKYYNGPQTIAFVTRSVAEIMQRLHAGNDEGDPRLLLDVFFIPSKIGESERRKKPNQGNPAISQESPVSIPPSRLRPFIINSVKGGFSIHPGSTPFRSLPAIVRIEAAYDIRKGEPIKKWTKDDFQFGSLPLYFSPKPAGLIVKKIDGNSIDLEIRQSEFTFGIVGFDTKRDLFIRAIEIRGGDETEI